MNGVKSSSENNENPAIKRILRTRALRRELSPEQWRSVLLKALTATLSSLGNLSTTFNVQFVWKGKCKYMKSHVSNHLLQWKQIDRIIPLKNLLKCSAEIDKLEWYKLNLTAQKGFWILLNTSAVDNNIYSDGRGCSVTFWTVKYFVW